MYYQYNRGNKYRSISTQYNGITYHSKFEAGYAQELDLRVKAKDILSWSRQIPVDIVINGIKICRYYVDFLINHHDGSKELVEIKGFETDLWRIKRRLLEAWWLPNNPVYFYTVIKDSKQSWQVKYPRTKKL